MSLKRKLADGMKSALRALISGTLMPLGKPNRDLMLLELSQEMIPTREVHLGGEKTIKFFCPSIETLKRAERFFTAEPDTLTWIDSFGTDETLWDIGANIGVYSLYAAIKKNVRVLSFEPSAGNYWILNRNIQINCVDDRISAYCVAFSRNVEVGAFNMGDTRLGGAYYQFGREAPSFIYPGMGTTNVVFHQGMLGFRLDEFVRLFDCPFPSHVKIDVDGLEEQIIEGSINTLSDTRLRSLSIELDSQTGMLAKMTELLKTCGLVAAKSTPDRERDIGSEHIYNFVFKRESE